MSKRAIEELPPFRCSWNTHTRQTWTFIHWCTNVINDAYRTHSLVSTIYHVRTFFLLVDASAPATTAPFGRGGFIMEIH